MLPITIIESSDFNAIRNFYVSCGDENAPDPNDRVLVARDGSGKIVGAVRLCNEDNIFVLRTMEVVSQMQRQGIGTKLLGAFKDMLGTRECYCIAYPHLDSFYGKIGFNTISFEEAPLLLKRRISEYRSRKDGKEFILMKKPAT